MPLRRPRARLLLGLAVAAAVTTASAAQFDALIPRLMRAGDIPGLSMVVLDDHAVAWNGTFGVREAGSRQAVAHDTVFEAASLSKTVFAYVALRLVDQGVLDLDTPLVQYAPYGRLAGDPRHRRVTARMCLSHTTGLPNWGTRFIAEPGARFTYSGEGIRFLRMTLEAITGLGLEELARREAFTPLGMTDSSYLWRDDFGPRLARGHDPQGRPQPRRQSPAGSAAASLHTTARDYARFLQACLAGEGLSPAMHAEMLRPQTRADLPGGTTISGHVGWGLGWGTMDGRDGEVIWQWGDNGDTVALVAGCPATGDGLVYFANSATGLSVAYDLLGAVLPGPASFLDALDYQRYDSPERVHLFERRARAAVDQRQWARAGRVLRALLDVKPGHRWATDRLEEVEMRRASRGPRRADQG